MNYDLFIAVDWTSDPSKISMVFGSGPNHHLVLLCVLHAGAVIVLGWLQLLCTIARWPRPVPLPWPSSCAASGGLLVLNKTEPTMHQGYWGLTPAISQTWPLLVLELQQPATAATAGRQLWLVWILVISLAAPCWTIRQPVREGGREGGREGTSGTWQEGRKGESAECCCNQKALCWHCWGTHISGHL